MKKHITGNQATYLPMYYKTFEGAMMAFLEQECPQIGGTRTRQVLAASILDMVHKFYPKTSNMQPGQMTWVTVHKDEKGSYGKSIKNTELTSVILDLVQPQDVMDRANGKKLRDIKKEATARLYKQAYEQNGCLTNAEIAIMLKISPSTVSKYISEVELETKTVLPRRGTIHDIGPSLTHKKIIIHKLFMEGKTVQQVSRDTYHSVQAIQRYIVAFKQILLCRRKQMTTDEIAYSVGKTKRLVKEYEKIIDNYKEKSYILDKLLNYEAKIETQFEQSVNDMMDK
jgi:DNA-binding CsgD family transcriptional regulator